MLGIRDEVTAYFLDRAVTHFGTSLEEDLEAAAGNDGNETQKRFRRQQVLDRWLDDQPETAKKGRFADPAARVR